MGFVYPLRGGTSLVTQGRRVRLDETARQEADKKDLGLRRFTGDELALLRGFAPNSKALLTRMRDGDEAAVAPTGGHAR